LSAITTWEIVVSSKRATVDPWCDRREQFNGLHHLLLAATDRSDGASIKHMTILADTLQ